jgi:hypothetical protein
VVVSAVFHGDPAQLIALLNAIERNCSCADPEVGKGKCPAHRALLDQRFLDGLMFAHQMAERLLAEEFR